MTNSSRPQSSSERHEFRLRMVPGPSPICGVNLNGRICSQPRDAEVHRCATCDQLLPAHEDECPEGYKPLHQVAEKACPECKSTNIERCRDDGVYCRSCHVATVPVKCPECKSKNVEWRDCPECKGAGVTTCAGEGSGGNFACDDCGFYKDDPTPQVCATCGHDASYIKNGRCAWFTSGAFPGGRRTCGHRCAESTAPPASVAPADDDISAALDEYLATVDRPATPCDGSCQGFCDEHGEDTQTEAGPPENDPDVVTGSARETTKNFIRKRRYLAKELAAMSDAAIEVAVHLADHRTCFIRDCGFDFCAGCEDVIATAKWIEPRIASTLSTQLAALLKELADCDKCDLCEDHCPDKAKGGE